MTYLIVFSEDDLELMSEALEVAASHALVPTASVQFIQLRDDIAALKARQTRTSQPREGTDPTDLAPLSDADLETLNDLTRFGPKIVSAARELIEERRVIRAVEELNRLLMPTWSA